MRPPRRAAHTARLAIALATIALIALSSALAGPPEDAAEARRLFEEEQWEPAAAAYKALLDANPYSARVWQDYGYAVHQLGRYEESLAAFTKSMELGHQVTLSMYNICCAQARLGHVEEGLAWLQAAMDAGFAANDNLLRADPDLDALRDDPRFRQICGIWPPPDLSRAERWRYDLDWLAPRLEQVHYNLYGVASREQIAAAFDELRSAVPELADHQVGLGIQRILAMVGDGHTHMRPPREGPMSIHRYPLDLYLYEDGLYVQAAARDAADAAGGRVVKLGNVAAAEAVERVRPLCSVDNPMGVLEHAPRMLAVPEVLHTLGIVGDVSDPLVLVVERADGTEATVEISSIPYDDASPDFVVARESGPAVDPLYLKHVDRPWWFEHLPEADLVYFQFNAVRDDGDETLAGFCTRLFAFIEEQEVDFLVIDMRHNNGGNNFLNKPLVHGLIRCERVNRPGHLFVIAGRRTFSAAMNGAADIEANTEALFVGEPTGSKPNFVGETTILTLPCTRLQLSCSSLYWQRSHAFDDRIWIAPDLRAEPSFELWRTNRDPAMEAILAYLAEKVSG